MSAPPNDPRVSLQQRFETHIQRSYWFLYLLRRQEDEAGVDSSRRPYQHTWRLKTKKGMQGIFLQPLFAGTSSDVPRIESGLFCVYMVTPSVERMTSLTQTANKFIYIPQSYKYPFIPSGLHTLKKSSSTTKNRGNEKRGLGLLKIKGVSVKE